MTNNDLEDFEPRLATALLAMMDAKLGPAFDMADVQEVAGDDTKLIRGPFASASNESATMAATEALQRMSRPSNASPNMMGIFALVVVGARTVALAGVKAVAAALRDEVDSEIAVICGALVDPGLGRLFQVTLWAR